MCLRRLAGCVLATLFTFCPHLAGSRALAQAARAEIVGEVRDPNGGVVGGAAVHLVEINNGNSISLVTGPDGVFIATAIKPGSYSVAVDAPGFRRLVRGGIVLSTGERLAITFSLSPGEVSDEIAVTSDAPLLRAETGSLGQVVDSRRIAALPLNGRNFLSLVTLAPGVAAPPRTSEGPSLPRVNGGRPRVNEYLFDGISALQPEPGQVAFFPVIEAIYEFKVELNSPSAEFGRFNGGVVNLTTKSGTNETHGSVFEFLRNEAFNARNLFAPASVAGPGKPVFRRNQFGAAGGGPLVRNRTFYFADYQGTRQLIARVRISTVPTAAQRRGDFSSGLGALLYLTAAGDVTTVAAGNRPILTTDTSGAQIQARQGMIFRPSDRLAYAGNIIPTGEFDSVAARLIDRYPLPASTSSANNYSRAANESLRQDQFDIRLDHRVSGADQFFGRFSLADDDTDPVTPLPDGSGAVSSGAIGLTRARARQLVFNHLHIFGPSLLNELRAGYTRRSVNRRSANNGEAAAIPGVPANAKFGNRVPTIAIAGFQQLGPPANANSDFRTDVTQVSDTVALHRGGSVVKFGIDFRLQRLDVLQPPSPAGLLTFNNLFTNSGSTPLASVTGNSLAGFLLGQVANFSIDIQPDYLRPRARIFESFVQSDWKAARRLTVNAGVRHTLNFPSTEAGDRGAVFNLGTQKLEFLGRDGFPRTARRLHVDNFGPRVGLAYQPAARTVVRAGYGLVWQEQAGITTPFTIPQFPFVQSVTLRTLDNLTPAFRLAGGAVVAPIAIDPDAGLGQGVFTVDRDLGSGYTSQWNVAIQRELSPNLVFEIAYAGSKVTHVGMPDVNINQLTVDQLRLGATLLERVPNPFFGLIPRGSSLGDPTITRAQLLKPYPRFTTVSFYRHNVGNTNYNALMLKLEKRLSRGLSFLVSYTRSKLIDEASSVFDATIQTGPVANFPVADSFNRRLERDVSSGDIPNILTASFTWDLPGPKSKGTAGAVLGGWSINGIINLQSGLPLPVSQATNFNAFAGFGTQRPNLTGQTGLDSGRTTSRWFNVDAFSIAPQFTLGTSSRNPVRGPGLNNLDLALIKTTSLTERLRLEFRAEAFNLTNTPPLGNPNVVLGSPGFGSITSAGDPRVLQFGLKLHF